ncbi:MAG: hypothetical protein JXA37_11305 [Chloroflexia bacterium]|nr:hypothetical protein [Chloroflexia bacterium]
MSVLNQDPRAIYEIQVQGELDPSWQQWFSDMAITCSSEQVPTTTLIGSVTDQAALRGILCKLWDLNLTLISVYRIAAAEKEARGND